MTPQEYICPITLLPMTDPVIGSDGQTYEREAITHWLQLHNSSPLTRQPMTVGDLRTNHSLKSAIERWNKKPITNPKPSAPPPPSSDYYVALTMYQQDIEQHLLISPLVPQIQPVIVQPQQRKVQACLLCVCLFVLFIIVMLKIMN